MRTVTATYRETETNEEVVCFAKPFSFQLKDFPRTTVDYPKGFEGPVSSAVAAAARAAGVLKEEPKAEPQEPEVEPRRRTLFGSRLDAVANESGSATGKISFEG